MATAEAEATACPTHPAAPAIGTCERCGTFVCRLCVGERGGTTCERCREVEPPLPFNGWLIMAFLVLVARIVYFVTSSAQVLIGARGMSMEDLLADRNRGWLLMSAWSVASTGGLTAFAIFILPAYLQKRRRVPDQMVQFFGLSFALNVVNAVIGVALSDNLAMVLVLQFVVVAAWIKYFKSSDRVRATFRR